MKGRTDIVIGVQWGDEGKGRVVDVLAADAGVVVRYQGGANAGHTVVVDNEKATASSSTPTRSSKSSTGSRRAAKKRRSSSSATRRTSSCPTIK